MKQKPTFDAVWDKMGIAPKTHEPPKPTKSALEELMELARPKAPKPTKTPIVPLGSKTHKAVIKPEPPKKSEGHMAIKSLALPKLDNQPRVDTRPIEGNSPEECSVHLMVRLVSRGSSIPSAIIRAHRRYGIQAANLDEKLELT